ncbi:hypothetical protein RB195_008596 [Necator americanus]|uniref:Uncharacterized protein n=1 Tax=Necator americanus TaxID=51031 RepID=A0ABR1CPE9_NECAM
MYMTLLDSTDVTSTAWRIVIMGLEDEFHQLGDEFSVPVMLLEDRHYGTRGRVPPARGRVLAFPCNAICFCRFAGGYHACVSTYVTFTALKDHYGGTFAGGYHACVRLMDQCIFLGPTRKLGVSQQLLERAARAAITPPSSPPPTYGL